MPLGPEGILVRKNCICDDIKRKGHPVQFFFVRGSGALGSNGTVHSKWIYAVDLSFGYYKCW